MWQIIAWLACGVLGYGWLIANYREIGLTFESWRGLYILAIISSFAFIFAGPLLPFCTLSAFGIARLMKMTDKWIVFKWRLW